MAGGGETPYARARMQSDLLHSPPSRLFRACRLQAYFRYPLLSPTPLLSSHLSLSLLLTPPSPRSNSYLLITATRPRGDKLVQKYAAAPAAIGSLWRTFATFGAASKPASPPPPIFIQEDAGGADATLVGGAGAPQEAPPRANSRRSPRSSAALGNARTSR